MSTNKAYRLHTYDAIDIPPVLDAYDRQDGCGLAIWCIYCKRYHFHGHGEGHRVAHCFKEDSPYQRSGYTLKPIGLPIPTRRGRPVAPGGIYEPV